MGLAEQVALQYPLKEIVVLESSDTVYDQYLMACLGISGLKVKRGQGITDTLMLVGCKEDLTLFSVTFQC